MQIGNRIKKLRTQSAMTQKELSSKLGVSTVSVQCWEAGTKSPATSAIIAMSKTFGVSTDYLLGLDERANFVVSDEEKTLLSDYRELDKFGKMAIDAVRKVEKCRMQSASHTANTIVISKGAAKRYIPRYITPSAAGIAAPIDGEDFEMVPIGDNTPRGADFAVGIQGNSMMPYILDGDTVYVKQSTDIEVGDVGIFCVDGAMYCKQYYKDDSGNIFLLSSNPSLQHTNVTIMAGSGSYIECMGKVLLNKQVPIPDYFLDSVKNR